MKKYLSKILCLLMALALVFCFAACVSESDDDDDGSGSTGGSSITGTYYIYEMEMNGTVYDRDWMEENGKDYKEIYLKLKSNGTGVLNTGDEEEDMEWDEEYIWPEGNKDEAAEYTYSNGKLTLEADGIKMVFKKG